jgi:hypothetical protein
MSRVLLLTVILSLNFLLGCGEPKAVIPTTDLTEEQKAAIKAQDQKIADEESHGAKKR